MDGGAGMVKTHAHKWRYHTPPVGPDWQECKSCDAIEWECEHCYGVMMPAARHKCTECGNWRGKWLHSGFACN